MTRVSMVEPFKFKVLRLWMQGYTKKQIAEILDDSENHVVTVLLLVQLEYECAIAGTTRR